MGSVPRQPNRADAILDAITSSPEFIASAEDFARLTKATDASRAAHRAKHADEYKAGVLARRVWSRGRR